MTFFVVNNTNFVSLSEAFSQFASNAIASMARSLLFNRRETKMLKIQSLQEQ